MPRRTLIAMVAGASVFLGACTSLRWEKDGVAVDDDNPDWSDCRREAALNASHAYFDPLPRLYVGRDALGRPIVIERHWPDTERFMLEHDLLTSCMRQRGYALVPVNPG